MLAEQWNPQIYSTPTPQRAYYQRDARPNPRSRTGVAGSANTHGLIVHRLHNYRRSLAFVTADVQFRFRFEIARLEAMMQQLDSGRSGPGGGDAAR